MSSNLVNRIKSLASENFEEAVSNRRHIHQHPELSFEEYKTSDFIQKKLKSYGIPFTANVVETGVVALIKGDIPSDKTIALRADMDAVHLQVRAENNEEALSSVLNAFNLQNKILFSTFGRPPEKAGDLQHYTAASTFIRDALKLVKFVKHHQPK